MPKLIPIASHKSQTDLAKVLGVTRQRINEMMAGRVSIGKKMAVRLEEATGIPRLSWLYPDTYFNPLIRKSDGNGDGNS